MWKSIARLLTGSAAIALIQTTALRPALAQPPDPGLLDKLSHHAEEFAALMGRGSYEIEQASEELDGNGGIASREITRAHVDFDGTMQRELVESCLRDGKNVTTEKQEQVRKAEAGEDEGDGLWVGARLPMPFLEEEQVRYAFDFLKADPADPSHALIAFAPKKADRHTMQGTAWVDATSGALLSASAFLSKPAGHADWIRFTVDFGEKTPLGEAISRISYEAKGSFLLFRKHVRGEVVLSHYKFATP
jgi:hypothetical protein